MDYQKQFSKDSHDLGRCTLLEHHINIMPGTRPIKQQPYRLPLAKRRDAEAEISGRKGSDRALKKPLVVSRHYST